MNTSNVASTPSRPFGGWGEAIVEAGGSCGKSAWGDACEEEPDHCRGRAAILLPARGSHSDVFRETGKITNGNFIIV
jgi:hypothetical protein